LIQTLSKLTLLEKLEIRYISHLELSETNEMVASIFQLNLTHLKEFILFHLHLSDSFLNNTAGDKRDPYCGLVALEKLLV
jgi:hypothetical protein